MSEQTLFEKLGVPYRYKVIIMNVQKVWNKNVHML